LFEKGPLSVAVDTTYLGPYKGGIIPGKGCGEDLAHAVLIVGYGTENG